jgi:tripartite-type tricarboxylate transporter receptor subunit TctC
VFKKLFVLITLLVTCNTYAQRATPFYVPFAVGGLADRLSRTIANSNSNYVAINKPGAQGQIAINEMIKNPGPMLIAGPSFYVSNPLILKNNLTYNPDNLEVIALIGDSIGLLACNKKTNINSVQDIIDYKGILSFGSAVRGGTEHLITEWFLNKIDKNQHTVLNYSAGGNKHILDLLGGHIDCVFGNMGTMIPLLAVDKLNIILSTHNTDLHNVPTWKTQFGTNFEFNNTTAIIVDRRWPAEFKNKILNDFKNVLTSKDFKNTLENLGHTYNLVLGKPADEELQKNNKVIYNFLIQNKIQLTD